MQYFCNTFSLSHEITTLKRKIPDKYRYMLLADIPLGCKRVPSLNLTIPPKTINHNFIHLSFTSQQLKNVEDACLGTEFGDQFQVVGGQKFHRVEENSFEAEYGEDGVGGVEVNIGEDIRHDVIDHVLQPGNAVHQQRYALWCYAYTETKPTLLTATYRLNRKI
jgi:hypothetical protein